MSTRSRRATSAAGIILLLASLLVALGLPAMAAVSVVSSDPGPGAVCPTGGDWSGHLFAGATGTWGSATFGANSVNVDLNPGYVLEVCAKGGSGYVIYQVTDNGGVQTVNAPSNCGLGTGQCGLSHWAYRVITTPSSTTAPSTTSTSEATTTTGQNSTTTTVRETTTTTGQNSTTTTAQETTTTTAQETTTTTAQGTTTTTNTATTPSTTPTSLPFDSVPEVSVLGIQVSAPEAAQVATQETLPFTGVSTSSMALLAAAFAGAGLLLLLAARQNDEKSPARSWN